MNKYLVKFHDNEERETVDVGKYPTKEEAVNEAYNYIDDKYDGDFDGDEEDDVKSALMERDFYVIGYGDSDICIEEI